MLNLLNTTDFYSYSGLSISDINESYVDYIISQVNGMVDQKLSRLFEFHRNFTNTYYPINSDRVVLVGNWQPEGVVDSITITNGGTGYTSIPTVTVDGNATATAEISNGSVSKINIIYQGRDYTTTPNVTLSGGGGTNATATATVSTLTIQLGYDGSNDLTTLVEGDDYRVIYYKKQEPIRTYPIQGIKLYYQKLFNPNYLKITGTFGFSNSVPSELMLPLKLYDVVKKVALSSSYETDSGGKGNITQAKIDKISTSYGDMSSSGQLTTAEGMARITRILDNVATQYEDNGEFAITII